MLVAYDISVLGMGHYSSKARTGVFRVVDNVAHGLVHSNECDVVFCASRFLNESIKSVHSNDRLRRVAVSYPRFRRYIPSRLSESSIESGRPSLHPTPLPNIFGKILHRVSSSLEACFQPLDPKLLASAQIFHSPYLGLPDQVRQTRGLTRFLTVHDLFPILYPQYVHVKVFRHLTETLKSLQPQDWILCVSHATKNDVCDILKADPSRAFVTHLAAQSELFYPCTDSRKIAAARAKYGIPDSPYILSVTNFEPRKNMSRAIWCFANLILQEGIKDLFFVMVGARGWNFEQALAEIPHCPSVRDRIIIPGYVADQDLAALYSGALAFFHPSLYEGFGLPQLEAMQCGVAVITSNTSSLPEVVGDAGIMCDPTDTDALCQALLNIYTDASVREAMSLKSLERARRFRWDTCVQKTIAAYKIALAIH